MEPEQALKAIFLIATSTILFVNSIPALRNRFIAYGPRTSTPEQRNSAKVAPQNPIIQFLDHLAGFSVPHGWFTHFYIASVFCSLFWASQLLLQGRIFEAILSSKAAGEDGNMEGMSLDQVILVWLLMTMQGCRRLYESLALGRPSQSKMWFGHWFLGIGFYMAVSMAVWVEGIPVLRGTFPSMDLLTLSAPALRTLICLPIFLVVSGVQYDCHSYLAALKKYTLPKHPIFLNLICPHYTAECLIYLSLAFLAAPCGRLLNTTIFTAFIFVTVNLGVTAETSREWYAKKFGPESIHDRWRMIPLVY